MNRLLIFLIFVMSFSVKAEIDFYLLSDFHADYDSFERMVKAMSHLRQQRQDIPQVLGINGDSIFGMGNYTDYNVDPSEEVGMVTPEAFALLGNDYYLISGLGNHDTSDFGAVLPVEPLFEYQISKYRDLLQRTQLNSSSSLLVANFELPSILKEKLEIQSHRILEDSKGKKIRIVPMVLEGIFGESTFPKGDVFIEVRSLLEVAIEQIVQASDAGEQAVAFLIHERTTVVEDFIEALLDWKAKNKKFDNIKIPFVQAGHDHIPVQKKIGETLLVNSGAMGEFTKVTLDNSLDVKVVDFQGEVAQKGITQKKVNLSSGENEAIKVVNDEIARVDEINSTVLGKLPYRIDETRTEMKKERTPLGVAFADALSKLGDERWPAFKNRSSFKIEGSLSFWNSGSNRREEPIAKGDFTVADALSLSPSDFPRSVVLKGEEIQEMYTLMRKDRIEDENILEYTPQIAKHMQEGENYQLLIAQVENADFNNPDHWAPIKPEGLYLLTTNFFVYKGAFNYGLFEETFKNATQVPALEGFRPKTFNTKYLWPEVQKTSKYYGAQAGSCKSVLF